MHESGTVRHLARATRVGSRPARVVAALLMAALALPLLAGAASATTVVTWHRLNVANNPPEHERFSCVESDTWRCRYDKLPDPKLGLSWDQTRGTFSGSDTTADWVCPDWFPASTCDAADTVVSGVGTFVFPRASGGFSVDQQLLVSADGRMWIYWGDGFQFVCPWYPTFDAALSNDSQCVFAP